MSNTAQHKQQLRKGLKVEIYGLQGAKHLNGKTGRLKALQSSGNHTGRWAVRVSGENFAIKPENLRPAPVFETEQQQPRRQTPQFKESERNAWAKGLDTADKYEWFSNCYQMRCDDDSTWGMGNYHGPYDPDRTAASIRDDFMVFCLLAVGSGCVPARGWDWEAFLATAAKHVVFAFEKSDAHERWGGENVFKAMMGGRSLRFTAEYIYETKVTEPGDSPKVLATIEIVANGPSDLVLDQIGGRQAWDNFLCNLVVPQ
eukprot:CAMPEP_0197186524 /NCGR_PEP_ID=MMETSP1423-20130617/14113_1 /TAXON_ID=476441 /ORGANISM="Pseudo-nitzschia heimii, Strain UNC1101" /LENGTH=257 /DNA_ID=CAMNT_0042637871 /DNA_START=65 /DNA_END=838 /DNA_ORIENTATION=+